MRRKDREVTDLTEIEKILNSCKTAHVAMIDGGLPYVVPLSYGYEISGGTLTLYFHSAKEGRKINALKENNKVCFEMCNEGEPVFAKINPCNSGYYFSSIIGNGEVEFIENEEEKCYALTKMFERQADLTIDFTKEQAFSVRVFKIVSKDFVGKRKEKPLS